MKFKNMKIAITDEVHLKAVCDVLESMGYRKGALYVNMGQNLTILATYKGGEFLQYCHKKAAKYHEPATLTDLLAMRDQIFMESIR